MTALAIAITGGIASGKSALAERFERIGVPLIDADRVSRELVEPGTDTLAAIVARFGDVLDAEGRLDRPRMRQRVFADPAERLALEAILHPRIRIALQQRARSATAPYVLLAIPLLAESSHYPWLDRILVVDVPHAVQLARVIARDRVDEASARATIAAQASREQRLRIAHDVVVNDAAIDLLDVAAARLHRMYLQRAAARA